MPWQASIHLPNLLGEEGDVTRLHGTATDEPRLYSYLFCPTAYSDSPLGKLRKTPKNSSNTWSINICDLYLIKIYQYIPTYSHHFHGFHRFFHGSVDTRFLQDLEEVVLCTFVATCTDTLGRGRWMKRWMGCRVPIFCWKMLVVGGCRLVQNSSKSHSGINCHHTFYIFLRYQTTRGFGWFLRENEGILGFATAWKAQEEAEQLQQKRQVDLPRAVHLMMGWVEGFLRGEQEVRREVNNIWLVVWNIWIIFPYIGNNHPNWRTPSFFRGVGVPTTNQIMNWLLSVLSWCIQKQTGWQSLLNDVGMLLVFLRGWVETTIKYLGLTTGSGWASRTSATLQAQKKRVVVAFWVIDLPKIGRFMMVYLHDFSRSNSFVQVGGCLRIQRQRLVES